jgi:asparagine synthase (glutamine-hydrolysing)
MCGIYGITYPQKHIVKKMIQICQHRGPDGQNIYIDNNVCIGHNLLAITDNPQQSLQPWQTPKGNILSYNGEIFNYSFLCEKYKNSFFPKTKCDTELLAWGLDQFGYAFIEEIDSMHAIAFYNRETQEILLSRDHAGIKPLYYSETNNNLIFSSEIKNMLEYVPDSNRLSEEGLACMQWCGISILDQTIFNNIKKLTAGETIIYDLFNKRIKNRYYYRVVPSLNHKFDPEEFRQQVQKTVQMTSVGIRDFGIFLSGGLDSGIIAYEMNKLNSSVKTFTNRFEVKGNQDIKNGFNSDADVAKILAQQENFNHHEVLISPKTLLDCWQDSIKINEEAIMNFNNFVYHYTNKFIKSKGVTVTMAGDMGDELLAGYYNHLNFLNNHSVKTADQFTNYFSLLNSAPPTFNKKSSFDQKAIKEKFKKIYLDNFWNEDDPLSSYMAIECLTIVPQEFLIRNDKLGMASSIEGRFPFTTKSFMKYCFSIPSKDKIDSESGILKVLSKTAYKDILPKEMIEKIKTGWSAPIGYWLSNEPSLQNLFAKNTKNISVPKRAGAKTYKRICRTWLYEDWKTQYNLV